MNKTRQRYSIQRGKWYYAITQVVIERGAHTQQSIATRLLYSLAPPSASRAQLLFIWPRNGRFYVITRLLLDHHHHHHSRSSSISYIYHIIARGVNLICPLLYILQHFPCVSYQLKRINYIASASRRAWSIHCTIIEYIDISFI